MSTGHTHDPDPTSTPVVPPATTTSSSGLPTGATTVGGAVLGATQIVSTPAVLVPGAPWAPDPFGTLQLIRVVHSKIESKTDPLKKEIELLKSKNKEVEGKNTDVMRQLATSASTGQPRSQSEM